MKGVGQLWHNSAFWIDFDEARHALETLVDSPRTESAHRFEHMIAAKPPEGQLPEGGPKTPVRRASRLRTFRLAKPKSEWTSGSVTFRT